MSNDPTAETRRPSAGRVLSLVWMLLTQAGVAAGLVVWSVMAPALAAMMRTPDKGTWSIPQIALFGPVPVVICLALSWWAWSRRRHGWAALLTALPVLAALPLLFRAD